MAQPENQLCADCREEGRVVRATDAGHIVPFAGKADPKRLDPSNLRPQCETHNSREAALRTAQTRRG